MVAAVAAMVFALALTTLVPAGAHAAASAAQSSGSQFSLPFSAPTVGKNEKMLVESDQLVYDYDHNTVSAVGNVKIYYAGYTLQAEKVAYNKTSGRLIATGNVQFVDPSGAAYSSEYIDITDDFRDGFVQSLRVDTPERTHFAAESASRSGGDTTTFVNGVYTACEPCIEHPEKPPLWTVNAAKIVVNHQDHTVYFTNAQIMFFGHPLATLPYFSIADPSVKRKKRLPDPERRLYRPRRRLRLGPLLLGAGAELRPHRHAHGILSPGTARRRRVAAARRQWRIQH
ncbi:MAG: hypothetical protein WDM84_08580 [Bauldia sp.]